MIDDVYAVITALRLEKALLEEQCQGEPWDVQALEYLERMIEGLADREPDEHTEHSKKMVQVVAKAMLYETAWSRIPDPSDPEEPWDNWLTKRAEAHAELIDAIRAMKGKTA